MSKKRPSLRFGRFELRPADYLLLADGGPVRLTPKAFDTLAALVRRRGSVVSREDLMREVWPDTFVEDAGLTQNISVIRKLLNEPHRPEIIETVPRRGYRFVAAVEEVHGPADPEVRLAVLPFSTIATDESGADITDGLGSALVDGLGAIARVRVTAFSTVARYRGVRIDPVQAARDLRVDAVVTGRLRLSESAAVLDIELVDADEGARIWGDRFERRLNALESLTSDVVNALVRALDIELSPEDRRRLERRDTTSAEAYADYLEGRHHLAHRTIDRVGRAIARFERAIERDDRYALAYAGLADAYTLRASAEYGGTDAMASAKAAATRALAIDESLAQAHASLALVHFRLDWNWALAEAAFRRAIALNPRDAHVRHGFAFYLIAMERRDEAGAEAHEAARLEPLSLIIATGLGRILHFAGDVDRAIEQLERVRDLEPSFAQAHFDLSLAYARRGRLDAAVEECRTAVVLAPGRPVCTGVLGHLLARAGRVAEARSALADLQRLVAAGEASPFDLALIHAGLNDTDAAIDALRLARRERHGLLVYLRVEPLWDGLRADPRFDELLRDIGLVQRF